MTRKQEVLLTSGMQLTAHVFTLATLLLASNVLGRHNLGTISLIVLCIAVSVQIAGFAGGGALVYLTSRMRLVNILVPGYAWSIVACTLIPIASVQLELLPETYLYDTMILSLLMSARTMNGQITLGKDKLLLFNFIAFVQTAGLFASLLVFFFVAEDRVIASYINALYIAYSSAFALSVFGVIGKHYVDEEKGIRELFRLGFFVQTANLSQQLNYRIGYYFVEVAYGREVLGLFSLATQCAEWIWKVPKSFAIVLYARVSAMREPTEKALLTLRFARMGLLLATGLGVVAALIPESVILQVVGDQFAGIRKILLWLIPGVILFVPSILLAHHFSGNGRHQFNALTSLLVLTFSIIGIYTATEIGDPFAVAAVMSAGYFLSSLIYSWLFMRLEKHSWRSLLFRKDDLEEVLQLFRRNQ